VNLLIIGGLLAVGIVAILGAILIGMSEQRAETQRNAHTNQPASIEHNTSTPLATGQPAASQPVVTGKLVEDSLSSRPKTPADNALMRREDASFPILNGQFHELAGEIRTLHEQAWQLEQRLSFLTKMVDHIEQSPGKRLTIEEENTSSSDSPLM
jgi:hypothetical protein